MTPANDQQGRIDKSLLKIRMAAAAIIVGLAIMAAKFYAWHLTGSSAILSDALESIINVVAGGFALAAVMMSARPPDEDHPFGHGKIEFFSAGFEGALIILAAFGIFKVGFGHLLNPQPLPHLGAGLAVLLGTAVVNLLLGMTLLRLGKKTGSLVLEADGQHILTDVYTSGGVVIGLFLAHLTGWLWLDGTIACLVGVNILWTGLRLVKRSFAGLMDTMDPDLLQQVVDLINRHRRDEWIDIHKLRVWRSGQLIHIDLHLILSGDLNLDDAHAEANILEQ
ncbi:MAG: cation transporter, partial [Desulfobacterales bacterium]|nr:cation transporter [Desulfobacterales bacterium]